MKLFLVTGFLSVLAACANDQNLGNNLRKREEIEDQDTTTAGSGSSARELTNKRRALLSPCVTVLVDMLFEDDHTEQHIECELQGDDAHVRGSTAVVVKGLDADFASRNNLESGVSTIYVDGAEIDDAAYELIIPTELKDLVEVGGRTGDDEFDSTRRLAVTPIGSRKVLVIRIQARDVSTTMTERELSNSVFGTYGDKITPRSQFKSCSNGQLSLDPVPNNAKIGSDSVLTVQITQTANGQPQGGVRDAALQQAREDLGVSDLETIAELVMVCLPPGVTNMGGGYVFGAKTVYGHNWCGSLFVVNHELGHALGLHHSNEGTKNGGTEYADWSGYMGGQSTRSGDGPIMCFNGPKTYQLGWFPNYHVELGGSSRPFSWRGDLVGFAQVNQASRSDKMIVRIQEPAGANTWYDDYYVHFNRAIGNNAGTKEGQNQVMVAARPSGTGRSWSYLLAKLSAGDTYTVNSFNGSGDNLQITVLSINTSTTPSRARITISLGDSSNNQQPTNPPRPRPTNPPPTRSPTNRPPSPTNSCVKFSTGTTYRITARHSGLALSVRGASKSNSAVIVQNRVSNGDASQRWNLLPAQVRSDGYYKLQNDNSDLMIGASGNRDGSVLKQYQDRNWKSQEFCFKSAGNGYYYIEAGHINKVFEVQSGSKSANANVRIFRNAGVTHEQWKITPASTNPRPTPRPPTRQPTSRPTPLAPTNKSSCASFPTNKRYRITARHSGLALSVRGASKSNSAVIVQNRVSNGDASQRWNLLPAQVRSDGYYKLQNDNSDLVVGASGNGNGSVMKQYQDRNWKSQEWCFKPAGNGYYYIEAEHIEKVFYVANGSRSANADIRLYPKWNGVFHEQWKVTAF